MRTAFLVLLCSSIAFVGGCLVGVGGTLYLQRITTSTITVTGVVMYEENQNPSASGLPPKGYYIDSTASDRVYIDGTSVSQYEGHKVRVSGRLDTVCGRDGTPCYPMIQGEISEFP